MNINIANMYENIYNNEISYKNTIDDKYTSRLTVLLMLITANCIILSTFLGDKTSSKDIGLLRVYNSDKCELLSTTCKLKSFFGDKQKIRFQFEHMYVPVEHSGCGSMGIYNFVLPIGYKLTDIHIVDPFDKANNCIEKKKHFRYSIAYDKDSKLQIVQMELRSGRGSFSFIVKGEATIKREEKYLDYEEREIFLDSDMQDYFFDDGIKKSFWQNLKDSLLLEPNFNGVGIDLKKLFGKHN